MINNRQNGRRRGRGGVRPPNGAGGNDRGSRIDNRSRGNAAQLYEKYKALARDTQMQGDRVMTEYYLQFADHYFRVLNENRSRFEEQNPRRSQNDFDDFGDDDGDGDGMDEAPEPSPRYAQEQQGQRRDRYPRQGDDAQNGAPNGRQGYPAGDRGQERGGDRNQDRGQERGAERDGGARQGSRDPATDQGQSTQPPRRDASREGAREFVRDSARESGRDARPDGGEPYRPERPAAEPAPDQPATFGEEGGAPRVRRGRRPRGEEQLEQPRIEIDRLPPALAPAVAASSAPKETDAADPAPRRRGRPRRASPDEGSAVEA